VQIDSCGRAAANGASFPESPRVSSAYLTLWLYAHTPPHGGGILGFPHSDFRASRYWAFPALIKRPPHTNETTRFCMRCRRVAHRVVTNQVVSTESTRHQVSESIRISCAIAADLPVWAVDSAVFSFRCRICLYSTSVQQIRATPSVLNLSPSPW
jgi:hypothetical protein